MCCCTIQLTSFTGQQTLHMQLHRPFSVLLCLTWSPTSSHAPALASHFKCILFYAKWLGALFRSSIVVIILCPECVEEKLDAWPTVQVPSAQNPSCFAFWKIELHKGSCISNLFPVESCYSQLSVQSTSVLPCTPSQLLSKNCLWQEVVAPYFHSTVRIIDYVSQMWQY